MGVVDGRGDWMFMWRSRERRVRMEERVARGSRGQVPLRGRLMLRCVRVGVLAARRAVFVSVSKKEEEGEFRTCDFWTEEFETL